MRGGDDRIAQCIPLLIDKIITEDSDSLLFKGRLQIFLNGRLRMFVYSAVLIACTLADFKPKE